MYKLQELRERGLEVKRDVNGEPRCDKTGSRITVWSKRKVSLFRQTD